MSARVGERVRFHTILTDSLGFVLAMWSIPAAILIVGTPIVMAAAMMIAFTRWVVQQ